jgi:hypothetical protein
MTVNPKRSTSENTLSNILAMGAVRSAVVNTIVYPIEVIKTNQQVTFSLKTHEAALNLFRSSGFKGFFKGFSAHFSKGIIKQTAWWPAIAYIPPELAKYNLSSTKKSLITGISVGTLDALVNSPLEKWRILASIDKKSSINHQSFLKEGWSGFFPYWRRQSVTWSLFFIGQHHFNKPYKKESGNKPLSVFQVVSTSTKLSLIANLIINPFDTLNTIKQSGAQNFKMSLRNVRILYRGFPLNFLSTMIQTTATVFLMDVIESKSDRSCLT